MAEEEKTPLQKIKEKYLEFVESLREKGVPLPHLVVPLVIILLVAGLAFLLVPDLAVEKKDISFTVKDARGLPVSSATVDVLVNNQSVSSLSQTSSASGTVSLKGVPSNAQVRISAPGFSPTTRSVADLASRTSPFISLQSLSPPTKDVSIKILDQSSQPINGAFVQIAFANGDFSTQKQTDASGTALITIEESKLSQGTVSVSAPGFQSTQEPVTQGQLESDTPITITVSLQVAAPTSSGDVSIFVLTGSTGVQGARVSLIDLITEAVVKTEATTSDGSVRFQNVSYGKSYTVRVTHPRFADASKEFIPSATSNNATIKLTTRATPESTITLTVVGEDREPVGAEVRLFDAAANSLLENGETAANGEFTTSVVQGKSVYATAYANGYLPGFISDLQAGDVKTISLIKAATGNSVQVTINVKQDGFPASNAVVSLFRSGGFFLGIPPLTASAEGFVNATIPTTLAPTGSAANTGAGAYKVYAKASKASAFGQSDLADVSSTPIPLSIDLLEQPANLTIFLSDLSTGQFVPNGAIDVFVGGLPVVSCTVQNGTCVLPVAANKEFTLHATAPGYLSYTSTTKKYGPAELANLTLSMFPLSLAQGVTVSYLGLFDSRNTKIREVQNGETYAAKFAVNMPQNIENAGFYFQAGDEQDTSTSIATITSFDTSSSPLVQGDSQLPANETCYDGQPSPNTDKKWLQYAFPRGFTGTKEFSINVKVAKTAAPGTNVNLFYKAFAFKDNRPLLYPSDTELLQTLREKLDAGQTLSQSDTCNMRLVSQTIPVSQQALTCSNEADYCWKMSLFDSTSRGTPSTFQPQIAKELNAEFEILSGFSIDSIAISTNDFTVKNFKQVLAPSQKISFIGETTSETTVPPATSGKTFSLPFSVLPNKKAKLSLTLLPLRTSQSTPFTIILHSGDKVYQIPLTLSISGTNAFTVTTAPAQINALQPGKITILVRDKTGNFVTDASISTYECSGAPFSGSEPEQVLGDATNNNGLNGRYRIDVSPSGIGEIGVRVEHPDFAPFESCAVTVVPKNFLTITPDTLEFTGSSLEPQAQHVTLSNGLNEPVKVGSTINCGGDPVPLKIFPTSTTIEPNSESTLSLKVLDNVTSKTNCIVSFNARIGTVRDVSEMPILVDVNCPNCQVQVATGANSAPLPPSITLIPVPPYMSDAATIPLRLSADPTCSLDGLRITYGGAYSQGAYGYGGQTYQQGVLAGLPTPNVWSCDVCSPSQNGASECNGCQQVKPSTWSCGACSPHQITAPTSSSLPYWNTGATCQMCQTAFSMYQQNAFMSPLACQGYSVNQNPAFMPQCGQGFVGQPVGQRIGFDRTAGAVYRDDYGYGSNLYGQRFGVQPVLPGSFYGPQQFGYNQGLGFSREAIKDAVQIEECTKDAITLVADYSFLQQPVPATGNLKVTLPDGSTKNVRVNVISAPIGPVGQIPFGAPNWNTACGISSVAVDAQIGLDYKFLANVVTQLTCPLSFTNFNYVVKDKDNNPLSQSCTVNINNNELTVNCDFSKDDKAKETLKRDKFIFIEVNTMSPQNPSAQIKVTIKATFETQAKLESDTTKVQPPVRAKVLRPTINVYAKADTGKEDSLCGERIQVKTPVVVDYTFPDGDSPTDRKLLIKNGGVQILDRPVSEQKSSFDFLDFNTIGSYSFEAWTKYGENSVSDSCQVTVVTEAPIIKSITPSYFLSADSKNYEWVYLFPESTTQVGTRVTLDAAAINLRGINSPNLKAKIEYLCQDGDKSIITQEYNFVKTKDGKNYVIDKARAGALPSLRFVKCSPLVNSNIPYLVKVTVFNNKDKLEEKYYDENNKPVDINKAAHVYILNYPEAPPINDQGKSALPEPISGLDACGRLNAPDISAIELTEEYPSGSGDFMRVVGSESLTPNKKMRATFCTTNRKYFSKEITLNLEYYDTTGAQRRIPIFEVNPPLATPLCVLDNNGKCSFEFNTNDFISPDAIHRLNLATPKGISFFATIGDPIESKRYFCNYWPSQTDPVCNSDKVEFKVATQNDAYAQNSHCRMLQPGNPNMLECDLKPTDQVKLPIGITVNTKAPSDYQGESTRDVDIDVKATFDDPAKTEEPDCNPNSLFAASFSTASQGKEIVCSLGGTGSSLGEKTELVAIKFIKKLTAGEDAFGWPTDHPLSLLRVQFYSIFGTNDDWLEKYYHYNFDLRNENGQLVREARYRSTPMQPPLYPTDTSKFGLYDLGINDVVKTHFSDSTGIVRYVGSNPETHLSHFEVRRRDYGVIQDCQPGPVGEAIVGSIAGSLLCFAPALNIAACPIILGSLGGLATFTTIQTLNNPKDPFSLLVSDTATCDASGTNPDIAISELFRAVPTSATTDISSSACVLIGSDASDAEDLMNQYANDYRAKCDLSKADAK